MSGKLDDIGRIEWFTEIVERLRDFSEGEVWGNGGDEIMCRSESVANAMEDLLTQLYASQGEKITICTGYYDPDEDRRNGEEDRCTGWWYVNIN